MINDTIKEHLFGPELTSTDDNSPHSPESGDEGTLKYTPFILFLVCILGEVLPYMGYISMCCYKGYGVQAVKVAEHSLRAVSGNSLERACF